MKTLYFDMRNGVSGDMVLHALIELSSDPEKTAEEMKRIEDQIRSCSRKTHSHTHGHGHEHGHEHEHEHEHKHRSYDEVKAIIDALDISEGARRIAHMIYAVIANAESSVHGDPLDRLHFHEVGRDRAVANVAGVAFCADQGGYDNYICSDICDGIGTVQCAHGTLKVPVPAVKAMLDAHEVPYCQTEREGERVTPSGLAMIIGLGFHKGEQPVGTCVRQSIATGKRSTEDEGLKALLYQD